MAPNIKQLKLITGEEILCDLTEALYDEDDIEHTLLIRSAFTLVTHEDFENQIRYYTFKPFMIHSYEANKIMALNAGAMICAIQPDKNLIDKYEEHVKEFEFIEPEEEEKSPLDAEADEEPKDDKVLKFKPKTVH